MVSYYGGTAMTDLACAGGPFEYTVEHLERRQPNPGWTWRGGDARAEGRVWGGCLEVVDTVLAADRTMPPVEALEGTVLLLETSEERPGEVRRTLLGLGERWSTRRRSESRSSDPATGPISTNGGAEPPSSAIDASRAGKNALAKR
ncbi:MAG: hypothetical protein V5A62_16100 [Haloarculaceae archaeon]